MKNITLASLRVAIGALLLWSGLDKVLSNFSAEGYLTNVTQGPFADIFIELAGNPVIDFMVIYGEIGIGLALVLGILVRFASVNGIIMMFLFYISVIPQEHGPISQHIIYIFVFLLLIFHGAGRYYGIDKYLEKKEFIKKDFHIWRYLLG
jgi:thiosulfate dehydrogenase [quinone] large subunit